MTNYIKSVSQAMQRRKPITRATGSDTKLDRCLTTFDLTALGIGSTLGLGMYILAGQVASIKAGPAVIISFVIAAFASILAGFCYAEFGARVPAAGSAYIYSYVSIGEFMAFLIGWNLIVEYLIGTASGARGYSGYLDALFDGKISQTYKEWLPFQVPGTSRYPDLVAALITLLITLLTSVGVKDSTRFNTIFTSINMLVVFYVISVGIFYADFGNWQLTPSQYENITEAYSTNSTTESWKKNPQSIMGSGGFFPFGISGVLAGAASCFYGFIGFDVIATTGEEVRNSKKAIPASIVMSLLVVLFAYLGISTVQTLIWPYWDQNQPAPLPYIFEKAGSSTSRYIINIGSLAGLSTSLLGALYPLPRVLYAMSNDGLIFRQFSNVNSYTRTPLFATLISGIFAAIMATLFDLSELADMMSIGTLLAYSLVAISVLILRYHHEEDVEENRDIITGHITLDDITACGNITNPSSITMSNSGPNTRSKLSSFTNVLSLILNTKNLKHPSVETTKVSCKIIWSLVFVLLLADFYFMIYQKELLELRANQTIIFIFFMKIITLLVIGLSRQPQSNQELSFKVPYIPYVPLLSCTINFYLMFSLSIYTWMRFVVWLTLGFLTYFTYGIRNSDERLRQLNPNDSAKESLKSKSINHLDLDQNITDYNQPNIVT